MLIRMSNPISFSSFISPTLQAISIHENEIESLDRAIGDGDHFINLKRGVTAIQSITHELDSLPNSQQAKSIGMKLLSSVGGASGPLFASFFLEFSKHYNDENSTLENFCQAFTEGVDAIKRRGKSDVGEKTMLDVLVPVAELIKLASLNKLDIIELSQQVITKSIECAESTKSMLPTKGRSTGLGDRAIGHMDPGAKSCQVIICEICNQIISRG